MTSINRPEPSTTARSINNINTTTVDNMIDDQAKMGTLRKRGNPAQH